MTDEWIKDDEAEALLGPDLATSGPGESGSTPFVLAGLYLLANLLLVVMLRLVFGLDLVASLVIVLLVTVSIAMGFVAHIHWKLVGAPFGTLASRLRILQQETYVQGKYRTGVLRELRDELGEIREMLQRTQD